MLNSIIIAGKGSFSTIQEAIDAADPHDVILLDGSFSLTSTLQVNKSVTITNAENAIVTIDASGVPAAGWGIFVSASDVTLDGFTLMAGPSGPARGIKASPSIAGPLAEIHNLTIENVVVEGFAKAEIDLNGVHNSILSDVTADGMNTAGAGIAITDSTNVELHNITTIDNAWGGVGIYTFGGAYAPGSDGIEFTGTFSSNEAQAIYTEADNGGAYPITNLTLPEGYDYAVYNDEYRPDASEFLTYFSTLEDAVAFAKALQDLGPGTGDDNKASVIFENAAADGQPFEIGDIIVSEGMSIQAAIDAAPEGATIWVGAGTYTENLLISKSVTLLSSDGPGTTIINGTSTNSSDGTIKVANGADDVHIGDNAGHGFTINGFDNPTTPAQETAAVYLLATSGQTGNDGFELRGNIVNANGDAALLSNWDAQITNAVIDGNTFGGKTFQGTDPASGDQFSVQNVARQLVVFGQGSNPATNKADNIDFTNNTITGTSGNATVGDNQVTIDAKNSLISGNTFAGYSAYGRFDLRARGPNTEISNNTVDHHTSQSPSNGFFVQNNPMGPFVGNTLIGDGVKDVLNGTDGGDLFVGSLGDDSLIGGLGSDTVDYSATTQGVTVNDAEAYSTGATDQIGYDSLSSIENVIGGSGDDEFSSTASGVANTFVGGAGNDTFSAGSGDDTFVYESAIAADGIATQINAVRITVNGAAEGNDDLRNVEHIVFEAGDGHGSGPITIDVHAGNAVVYAQNDTGVADEDGNTSSTGNVLNNDINLDASASDVKHVVSFGAGANATATNVGAGAVQGTYGSLLINADGSYSYTPNSATLQSLAQGEHVTDTFSYTAGDNTADTDTATLTVTVNGNNDAPTFGYNQTFDNGVGNWDDAIALHSSLVNRAGDTVMAPDGSQFAVMTESGGSGPFDRLGGFRSDFVDGLTIETQVYLDTGWTTGEGFQYTIASSKADGSFLRDFAFEVVKDNGGKLFVAATNNVYGSPRMDLDVHPEIAKEVASSGWYTLQHVFTENASGDLAVVMNVLDSLGAVVLSVTRTATTDDIAGIVGGNRYAWFADITVTDGLAVNGVKIVDVDTGLVTETAGVTGGVETHNLSGGVVFDDVDSSDTHLIQSTVNGGSGYVGTFTPSIGHDATGASVGGTLEWTFSVTDAAIESLAVGETLVQTYTVTIEDNHGGTASKDIVVTIVGANDAPVLAEIVDPLVIDEDQIVSATHTQVQALIDTFVSDVDLTDQHFVHVEIYNGSTLVDSYDSEAGGDFAFDPPANFHGDLTVNIVARDDNGALSNPRSYTLTVNSVVDLTGADSVDSGDEDGGAITGDLNASNATTSGGLLAYEVVDGQGPAHGSLVLNADGSYSYTPDGNYNGPDSFTYLVTDAAAGESDVHTVSITVNAQPDMPVFGGTDAGYVVEDGAQAASGQVTIADPDAGEAGFQPLASGAAQYGAFTFHETDGTWSYSLNNASVQFLAEGQTATDSVIIHSIDGTAHTISVTITGTNDEPVATADVDYANEGETITGNVLDNDSDADTTDTLTVSSVNHAVGAVGQVIHGQYGVLTLATDGSYTYVADHTASGPVTETFAYTVSDSKGGTDAYNITFDAYGDGPLSNGENGWTLYDVGYHQTVGGVADKDWTFTRDVTSGNIHQVFSPALGQTAGENGTTGSFEASFNVTAAAIQPTGTASYLGVSMDDGNGSRGNLIRFLNDGTTGQWLIQVADYDRTLGGPVGEKFTYKIVGDPLPLGVETNIAMTQTFVDGSANDVWTLYVNGEVVYTGIGWEDYHRDGFAAEHAYNQLLFRASGAAVIGDSGLRFDDVSVTTNQQSTLTIDVAGEYDAADITGTVSDTVIETGVVPGVPAVTHDLDSTDADAADADDAWTAATISGSYGELTIDAHGVWTYTLANDNPLVDQLRSGDSLTDTVTVTTTDGTEQLITINIAGTNDAPIATIETVTVDEDSVASGQITGSDVDTGETATLTFALVDPVNAPVGLTLNADGSYSFDASSYDSLGADQTLDIVVQFVAIDINGTESMPQDLTITITGQNDAPVFGFVQDFETDAEGLVAGGGYGQLVELTEEHNGIVAADVGGQFAVLEGTPTGPFTRLSGYHSDFTDGYTAEVKVYLDTNWATGEGFEYSVASNDQDGVHLRDFVLNVSTDQNGTLMVAGSNNAGSDGAVSDITGRSGALPVPASGWYTIRHVFNDVDGALSVTIQLVAANDTVVYETALSNHSDTIADLVGGNRYGWFTGINVPSGLAVDDITDHGNSSGAVTELTDNLESPSAQLTTSGRLVFDDADASDVHTVVVSSSSNLGTLTATIIEVATGANTGGTIEWTYNVVDGLVSHLAAGETMSETFDIVVSDGHGGTATQQVTILVTGTNDAPEVTPEAVESAVATEDTAFHLSVVDSFTDMDGDTLTYAATLSNDGPLPTWLHFDTTTGEFSGTPTNDDVATFTVKVTASDGVESVSNSFEITVNNTNDAPVFTADLSDQSMLEDSTVSYSAEAVSALIAQYINDVDVGDTLRVVTTISNGATVLYTYDTDVGGTFTFTPAADFHGALTVSVTATDGDGESTNDSFVLNVTSVNDAPEGADNTITINEDSSYTFTASDFGFSDAQDGNSLQSVKITTVPAGGTLMLGSTAVAAGQVIAAAALGTLQFIPALNANSDISTGLSFTFQVIDDGGTDHGGVDMDQTANTISFTVTPVDDPATLTVSGTPDLAVLESAGPQGPAGDPQASGSFSISDPDGPSWNELKPGSGGSYGTFAINANGTWTYALDDNNTSVQALNDGQTLTDSIAVWSKDLSVSQTVSVTIMGQHEVINGTTGDDTALNGTQWGDKITAGLGDDQVSAGSGDDLIYDYVGDGSDTYNGGSHTLGDTLIFSGNRADYTVTKVGPLFFFEHTDGTIDQATNIEFFKFADTGVLNQTAVQGSLAPTISNGGVADLGDLVEDNPNTFVIGNLNSYVTGTGPFTFGPTGTIATAYGQYQVLSNGQVLYQLDNTKSATNALAQGQIGIDSLNFTVTGPGGTANGSMKVDITGHNDAPVAVNDIFAIPLVEGAAGTFDVLSNDSDPDSAFHIVGINAVTNANVSGFPSFLKPEELTQLNSYFSFTGSQISFTPGTGLGLSNTESVLDKLNPGDTGTVTFNYVVQDALGAQSTATATFSITGTTEVYTGTAGNDVIEGSKYANEMHGLGGDDAFTAREFADSFFGDGGTDTVLYKKLTTGVIIDLTDGAPEAGGALGDQLYSIERIFGSETAGDWMKGGSESNTFYGGGGNDTLNGGGGDDLIYGGDNDDVIIGGDGNDNLQGDAGNDKLYGGAGDDLLYGGAGADQFIFDTLVIGKDQIRDFQDGVDKLVFDTTVYGTKADSFSDFTVIVIDTTHTNVLFDSGSGVQTMRFTHAAGGLTLDAGDFQFI